MVITGCLPGLPAKLSNLKVLGFGRYLSGVYHVSCVLSHFESYEILWWSASLGLDPMERLSTLGTYRVETPDSLRQSLCYRSFCSFSYWAVGLIFCLGCKNSADRVAQWIGCSQQFRLSQMSTSVYQPVCFVRGFRRALLQIVFSRIYEISTPSVV